MPSDLIPRVDTGSPSENAIKKREIERSPIPSKRDSLEGGGSSVIDRLERSRLMLFRFWNDISPFLLSDPRFVMANHFA
jgi:hypothetical protein